MLTLKVGLVVTNSSVGEAISELKKKNVQEE